MPTSVVVGETVTLMVPQSAARIGPRSGPSGREQSITSVPPLSVVGDTEAVLDPLAPPERGREAVMPNPVWLKFASLHAVTAGGRRVPDAAGQGVPSSCSRELSWPAEASHISPAELRAPTAGGMAPGA